MRTWALIFIFVAVATDWFGFSKVAAGAAMGARFCFAPSLLLFVLALVAALVATD